MKIDMIQGIDDNGKTFGFVYEDEGQGGWFFAWESTLAKTLRTLEPCSVEGDGGLDEDDVREFLRDVLPGSKEAAKFFGISVEG